LNPNGASTASPEASPAGRILVIDDEPANLALLHRILTAAGYESVELLADSRQALARYAAWRPDLVLLDLHMPHLDGLGVLAQLRGEIPSQEFLPVVILTGDATAETRKRALSAGAHDFIVKPFDQVEVVLRIGNLLHTRSLHEQLRQANATLGQTVQARTRELATERRFLRALLDSLTEGIIAVDAGGVPLLANPAVDRLAVPPALRAAAWDCPEDSNEVPIWLAEGPPLRPAELPLRRALRGDTVRDLELITIGVDGMRRVLVATATPIANGDGSRLGAVLALHDITDRRRFEDELRHRALHDELTGLPNRALFLDRLHQALSGLGRAGGHVAVLFLDMDDFKVVNDTLGHAAGDRVLREVARRLTHALRPGDTAARFGGDEFALLFEGLTDARSAADIADRVRHALAEQLPVGHVTIAPTVSIGLTVAADRSRTAEELVRDADVAMFRAKERGGNRHEVFDATLRATLVHRLELELALRDAIATDQLVVHYQPTVSLATGAITGMEALVRWNRPEQGLMPPEQFIPLAERFGLIAAIDTWVLTAACHQLAAWRHDHEELRDLSVAVNLSAAELVEKRLPDRVSTILADTGLPPSALCLELTESTLMQDPPAAVELLTALGELGVHIAVDDFGTGYSSLAYLRRLPVHTLKIDRAFIVGLPHEPDDSAVVTAIIALTGVLGLRTVAEGVESEGQAGLLRHLGCAEAQGYYFGRPVHADVFAGRLGVP
jgi:diguanylate cyclase (GGDEF)-like protein